MKSTPGTEQSKSRVWGPNKKLNILTLGITRIKKIADINSCSDISRMTIKLLERQRT